MAQHDPTTLLFCTKYNHGLNIPSLRHAIPIDLREILDTLGNSSRSDPTVVTLQKVEPAGSRLVKIDRPGIKENVHLRNSEDAKRSIRCSVTQSLNGKGLMEHDSSKPHGFLFNDTRLLAGSMFLKVPNLRVTL